ncbi:MAG: hypothetical protein ABIH86_00340 [Planctomycetota bacterium]
MGLKKYGKRGTGKRIRTLIRVGDHVMVISGEARNIVTETGGAKRLATVAAVDRIKGKVRLVFDDLARETDANRREVPIRGIESYKSYRFNPQADEPGGLRPKSRWIDISNVGLVDPSTGSLDTMKRKKTQSESKTTVVRVATMSKFEF